MVFNPNIPTPSEKLSASQPVLLTNNADLDASFLKDHTLFSDATANNGFHKQVTLYQVAVDPAQTFPSAKIYTKNSGVTPNQDTNLFFSYKPETGADIVRQLTGALTTSSANVGTAGGTIYRSILPFGITVYSGTTSAFSGSSRTVTFPVALSAVYGSSAVANNGSAVAVSCLQNTTGLAIGTTNNVSVNWIVWGAT